MKKQFLLILTAVLALIPFSIDAQVITVCGLKVTKQNASDLISHIDGATGKISYDFASHTLTMEDVRMDCKKYDKPLFVEGGSNFTLLLKGENIITTSLGQMELGAKKNVITGKGGILRISSPKPIPGIQVNSSELLITGGCIIETEGEWGIAGDYVYGTVLRINGKDGTIVKAKGREEPSIDDFGEIYLEDCSIVSPIGAEITTDLDGLMHVTQNGQYVFEQVVIKKVEEDYDISVDGIKVSADNAEDVLGDGKVSYLPRTRTLVMNGVTISSEGHPVVETRSDIAILFSGINTLTSDVDVFNFEKEAIMTCSKGSINATSETGTVVHAKGNLFLTNLSGNMKGKKGVWAEGGNAELKLKNCKLNIKGTESCVSGFKNIIFEGCHVYNPENTTSEGGQISLNGTVYAGELVIDNTIYFPLYVCNIQVSNANCKDILGDGTISYDIEKHVLALNNFHYDTEDFIQGIALGGDLENVTIILNGDNVINTNFFGISMTCNTTITGNGKLTIRSKSSAMVVNGVNLTIDEKPEISLDGDAGLAGYSYWSGHVKFIKSNVKIKGGFVNFSEVEFEDCAIKEPKGLELVNLNYVLNGEVYKGEIIISPEVSGIGSSHADRRVKNVTYYTASGSIADAPEKGVYIKVTTYDDGTKATVKVIM